MHLNQLIRMTIWFFALVNLWFIPQYEALCAEVPYPGSRVVLDAHNCYPFGRRWPDRMDRALSTGMPLAIEQDLAWTFNSRTGAAWSVLSHRKRGRGFEPTLKNHFFERVRPIVEDALKNADRRNWPLITLNLDFKSEEPQHLKSVWSLLCEYADWITSASRLPDIHAIAPLEVKPIIVLTGESQAQEDMFFHQVPEGGKLLVFGATPSNTRDPNAPPSTLAPEPMNNYRRWWNNPWRVVEPEGQNAANDWNLQKEVRLNELVQYAHARGFWIRFYTLNGISTEDERYNGWAHRYNFGSLEAAQTRWRAAIRAGVDFLVVDQYEELARELGRNTASKQDATATRSNKLSGRYPRFQKRHPQNTLRENNQR